MKGVRKVVWESRQAEIWVVNDATAVHKWSPCVRLMRGTPVDDQASGYP